MTATITPISAPRPRSGVRIAAEEFARLLVVEHAPPLRKYVARLLPGDPHRAEDIVQEALLRGWQHAELLSSQPSARPWLFRVARNLAFDWLRRQSVRPAEVEAEHAEGADLRALDGLDNVLRSRLIVDALEKLSDVHREVLMHLYYFGSTQAEVADLLGVAQGTIKSRAHYAVAEARQALSAVGVHKP